MIKALTQQLATMFEEKGVICRGDKYHSSLVANFCIDGFGVDDQVVEFGETLRVGVPGCHYYFPM